MDTYMQKIEAQLNFSIFFIITLMIYQFNFERQAQIVNLTKYADRISTAIGFRIYVTVLKKKFDIRLYLKLCCAKIISNILNNYLRNLNSSLYHIIKRNTEWVIIMTIIMFHPRLPDKLIKFFKYISLIYTSHKLYSY